MDANLPTDRSADARPAAVSRHRPGVEAGAPAGGEGSS